MANLLAPSTFNQYQSVTNLAPTGGFNANNPAQAGIGASQAGSAIAGGIGSGVSGAFDFAKFNNAASYGGYNALTGKTTPIVSAPTSTPGSFNIATAAPAAPAAPRPMASPATSGGSAPYTPPTQNTGVQFATPGIDTLKTLSGAGTFSTPNGNTITLDASGNVVGAPSKFSIDTSGNVPSDALTTNSSGSDAQSKYAQYLDQLAKAYEPTQDYLSAIKRYQDAVQNGMTLDANLATGNVPGDTLSYASGVTDREKAINALAENAASNAVNVQQTIRQGNIDATKALASGYAPSSVGIGTSLVDPATGQPVYQSPYLFKPTAGSINTVAQQLLQSGAAPDYNTAYNMAQGIVTATATGQTNAAGAGDVTQSPIYSNAMALLQQGMPVDQVMTTIGKSGTSKSVVQQAFNDFLGGTPNYNAAAAKAGYKFRQSTGAQTFMVNAKTAEDNIDKLIDLSNSFPRSQFPVANMAQLYALAQTGNTQAVNLYTYVTMLGDDLGKLLGSSAGSDYTTKLGLSIFNPNYSAKQLQSTAAAVKGVIEDKVSNYNTQFNQTTTGTEATPSGSQDMSAYAW